VQNGAHLAVAPLSALLAVQTTIYMEVFVFRIVQAEHTGLVQLVQLVQQDVLLAVALLFVLLAAQATIFMKVLVF